MKTLRSWAGNVEWTPRAIHHPRNEQEVCELVRRIAGEGGRLKPVGSGLSWSDINEVQGQHLLLLDQMESIFVDAEHRRVRVQGGALLKDINDSLARAGLSLDNFGSIVTQTAAGYIGTGTHGSGTPLLSTFIEEMRLVDGTGQVRELSREREPDLFSSARVHLGCLGVVTEIVFRCVEAFDLEERRQILPLDRVLADLEKHLAENDYLKLWWLPYNDVVQVYAYNKVRGQRPRVTLSGFLEDKGLATYSFTALLALSRAYPPIVPTVNQALQRFYFGPRRRVNRSDLLFDVGKMIPIHNESEYAIPRQHAAQAIDRLAAIVRAARPRYFVNFPMEVRFVPGKDVDDIPLSPATGRDSCYIGAYVASPQWTAPYHHDFEELMRDYDGRPHWGKLSSRRAEDFARLYPRYREFAELRARCDPLGIFRNTFVDRVFGL
jgi:L-gulonolactone oxidase